MVPPWLLVLHCKVVASAADAKADPGRNASRQLWQPATESRQIGIAVPVRVGTTSPERESALRVAWLLHRPVRRAEINEITPGGTHESESDTDANRQPRQT